MTTTGHESLSQAVHSRPWWHQIDLGGGLITPGPCNCSEKLHHLGLPERLDGLSVIDVGAWDGFFSFECERRGAARVLATDYHLWTVPGIGDKGGFELARRALQSKVEDKTILVEDLLPETVGEFDLVLFLGVLYHAQDPMLYLRRIRSICKGTAIIETHIDALDYPRPAMVFYPGATLNHDASNFWGPNPAAVESMLKEVGFAEVSLVSTCGQGTRAVFHATIRFASGEVKPPFQYPGW